MTVRDLIAALETFDGDLVVTYHGGWYEDDQVVEEVELATELRWDAKTGQREAGTVRIS